MKSASQNIQVVTLSRALQGVLIGAVFFVLTAFGLATTATYVDTSVVRTKIGDAIRTLQIQYPGKFDLNDKRGIDTFDDCIVLQALSLNQGGLLNNMFDTLIYDSNVGEHACNALVDESGYDVTTNPKVYSYNRYWWGSAVLARIVLGKSSISVKTYRSMIFTCSLLSLIILICSFFIKFGLISCVFLPFFVSLGLGYSLMTMGQSIAHGPEFIVGLLLLSGYCLGKV
jgi:hypothetical protein